MELIITIFNEVLYRPLFNILVWFYNVIPGHDLGVSIIVLTFLIRLIFYPLSKKAIQSQKAIAKIQPEIKKIQKKYKDKKEEQAKMMMEIYKKHKINPASGCLPILMQLPILIALYRVFFTGLDPQKLNGLYGFISRPESLDPMFLNIINLSQASIGLAILAGVLQFIQSKMIMPKKIAGQKKMKIGSLDFSSLMSQQMTYFMPLITVFIAWRLPAALPLYWIVITLFGIFQQYFTRIDEQKS
jgi:YidC/Oxa1 family membrane protein insertase